MSSEMYGSGLGELVLLGNFPATHCTGKQSCDAYISPLNNLGLIIHIRGLHVVNLCCSRLMLSLPSASRLIVLHSSGTELSCTWCHPSTSQTFLSFVTFLWGKYTCSRWSRSSVWLCSGSSNQPSWPSSSQLWYVMEQTCISNTGSEGSCVFIVGGGRQAWNQGFIWSLKVFWSCLRERESISTPHIK